MANLFHTSLFGYAKAEVNDYISKRNEEFSQKLLEKDQEHKREVEGLQAEAERLSRENERLLALRQEVADAIISAKDYAAGLQRQAEADDEARRAASAARQEAERRRIQNVAEQISGLHRAFRDALEHMDRELTSYTEELHRLQTAAGEEVEPAEQGHIQKEGALWEKDGGQAS